MYSARRDRESTTTWRQVCGALNEVKSAATVANTIASLSSDRLVGTHYEFYNTIVGMGILVGNLATGSLMQAARDAGLDELIWVTLVAIGLASAASWSPLAHRNPRGYGVHIPPRGTRTNMTKR